MRVAKKQVAIDLVTLKELEAIIHLGKSPNQLAITKTASSVHLHVAVSHEVVEELKRLSILKHIPIIRHYVQDRVVRVTNKSRTTYSNTLTSHIRICRNLTNSPIKTSLLKHLRRMQIGRNSNTKTMPRHFTSVSHRFNHMSHDLFPRLFQFTVVLYSI